MKDITIKLIIGDASAEKLEHIFNAEKELEKAGVLFDTGYDMTNGQREWFLDDMSGAHLEMRTGIRRNSEDELEACREAKKIERETIREALRGKRI